MNAPAPVRAERRYEINEDTTLVVADDDPNDQQPGVSVFLDDHVLTNTGSPDELMIIGWGPTRELALRDAMRFMVDLGRTLAKAIVAAAVEERKQ